ncbi:Tim44 domain-containing protein [Reyranella sp.]|uniref:Tim44 domain-containing protein n=1 Tax=Reyranella sp. TaxID=1929291 RepID=UPI003BAD4C38
MTKFRWLAILAALIIAVPSLAPSPADARAGGGGSRGSKSGQAPAPTQTAPTSKPAERSTTPQQQSPSANPASAAAAGAKPGFMQRNPFLTGLMGGMLGAGLIGMLMGGGFGAGLGSMAGMLGFLLQLALIGGIAYLAVRWWKSRNGAPQAAFAGAGAGGSMGGNSLSPKPAAPDSMARTGLQPMMGGMLGGAGAASAATATQPLEIGAADYDAFESLLINVQAAYSAGDLTKLRTLATPEMLGYFTQDLSANASRGVENKVTDVKLEQGDLSEAWSEGGVEYATVAMRFSMIDVMRNVADGRIVEGNEQVRTEATEVWTFLRGRGGNWIVSAIQHT